MSTHTAHRSLAAGMLPMIILAACATTGAVESSSPPPPARPSETPKPSPSRPVVTPRPSAPPSVAPTPSPTPVPQVRHRIGSVARSTADGVNVRLLPGLDQPLIDAENVVTREVVRGVTLDAGGTVVVEMGPIVVDGIGWYWVMDDTDDGLNWLSFGWVAGEYLEFDRDLETRPDPVVVIDGVGSGSSGVGRVSGGYGLVYHVIAAPVNGAAECSVAISLVDPAGAKIEGAGGTISEPTLFWQSQFENPALFAAVAGEMQLTVETDCSYAGVLAEVTQG
jgi:hypothetical protein